MEYATSFFEQESPLTKHCTDTIEQRLAMLCFWIPPEQLPHHFVRRDFSIEDAADRTRNRHINAKLLRQAVNRACRRNPFGDMAKFREDRSKYVAVCQLQAHIAVTRKIA